MVSTTFTYLSRLRHDNYVDVVVDTIHVASMADACVTYVDDEHADNNDHDDYYYYYYWVRLQRYENIKGRKKTNIYYIM